jgi:hypothetical protein
MTDFKLDMTMMIAFHDALRRDLEQVVPMQAPSEGWDLFARMLHVHHTVEDDLLWPVVRDAVAGQRDDVALVDAMTTEHSALAPLLESIDRALARGAPAPREQADLDVRLREHLTHEEDAALPLIDRTLSTEQWMTFGRESGQRVGSDMPRFLPWLLDGADERTATHLLAVMPPPVQTTYADQWRPAYAAVDHWATST